MYYLTLFIDECFVTCCIATSIRGKTILKMKSKMTIREFDHSLPLMLNQWFSSQSERIICRIVLNESTLMKRELQLPNLRLSPYEINTYVKNTLTKIFHSVEPLSYDYLLDATQHDSTLAKVLTLYACPLSLIGHYHHNLPQSLRLYFIGIPHSLLNCQVTDLDIDVIACKPCLAGINFMPWRDDEVKQKQRYFLLQITVCLLLLSMILIGFTYLSYQELNQHYQEQAVLQQKYQQMNQQLSTLIALQKQNKQLELIINQQQKSKEHLARLLDCFHLVAMKVPDNVWLNSVEYQNNTMKLTGSAFLHEDILLFVNALNRHDFLKVNDVMTIKRQHFLLQFQLDLDLLMKE